MTGRWVAAMTAAVSAGTSAANCWWNRSFAIVRSFAPVDSLFVTRAAPSVLPGNFPASVKADSPCSGAKAPT